ncbi:glutamate racemase [Commensalibacter melissae]|uniref:glutamate racemase n=1 Tax=Commensalibacter melissae TaxID=2070537 RepID=UPI0012D986A1|nr:glutamate racemase [Commensalibacter melissae]MUG78244.1 glutamate racemase [Commensalibacter melissae]
MPYRVLAFDSGIGGLGIVQNLQTQLKTTDLQVSIDYLADNLVFPYGEQEDNFLVKRIINLIGQAIQSIKPNLVIIACNTASTIALDRLRKIYPFIPFVGCVPPVRWAARVSQSKIIGLLATRATITRPYLCHLKEQFASDCKLIAYGSPVLAKLAENYFRTKSCDIQLIQQELDNMFNHPYSDQMDAICIGCTHYSFILDLLRQNTSPSIQWLDPAAAVAKHTIDILRQEKFSHTDNNVNNCFYSTAPLTKDKPLLSRLALMKFTQIKTFILQ